jgi:glycosyltransferase involved in cell wall biosynthesis
VSSAPELPLCSLVIATYRRPERLANCLEAVAALDYPSDRLEVVVVDDGGGIPLEPVLQPFRARLELRLLEAEHAGQSQARNLGVREARGDLLAFTDDDCRPDSDWLVRLARRSLVEPDAALGGHTVNALAGNSFAATSQLVIDIGYRTLNATSDQARFFTTNNLVVPRAGFEELGGFDVSLRTSEDRDFCSRWIAGGRRLVYVPDAIVRHFHDLTLSSFWRQHFAYGRGAFRFHRHSTERYGERDEIKPSFALRVVFFEPWRAGAGTRAWRFAALLQVWNLANAAGFVWEWMRSRNGRYATRFGSGSARR